MTKGIDIEQQVGDFLGDAVPENFQEEETENYEDFVGAPSTEDSDDSDQDGGTADDTDTGNSDADDDKGASDDDSTAGDTDGNADDDSTGDAEGAAVGDEDTDTSGSDDTTGDTDAEPNAEILALRELVQGLTTQLTELKASVESSAAGDQDTDDNKGAKAPEVAGVYVTDEDIDDVLADATKFNAMINKALSSVLGQAISTVTEAVPSMVSGHVGQQFDIRDFVSSFYSDNEDLVQVKKTVGAVANEVQAANPTWTLNKIFEETAKKTREVLGMPDPANRNTDTKGEEGDKGKKNNKASKKVALPPDSSGSRKGAPSKAKGVQKEINELI